MQSKTQILDESAVKRALVRIAHEIVENNNGAQNICLVGIQRRGISLAKEIKQQIEAFENVEIPFGVLDITFYRDDLSLLAMHPVLNGTDIPFDLNDKTVVLVDDVLYTGRTVKAAIEALTDLGRPKCIRLAVLIDRGHRELPIRADFIGKNVPTSKNEVISVAVDEFDSECGVYILKNN